MTFILIISIFLLEKKNNMNRLQLLISLILLSLFMSSCSKSGFIIFQQEDPYIFSKEVLRSYVSETEQPKVVLRVPTLNVNVIEKEKVFYNSLYDAIELELLNANFIVRDRVVFNDIVKNANDLGYEELRERTDTDIIIELINIDIGVEYTTNRYYTESGKEKLMNVGESATEYGALVEFKVVLLESNDVSGIYKFNYAPCVKGCRYNKAVYSKNYNSNFMEEVEAYELIERDILADFMSMSTKRLIRDLGK